MKVLLVRPDLVGTPYAIGRFGIRHQPLGLLYLAGPLVEAGHEVEIADEVVGDRVEDRIRQNGLDWVGITASSPLFDRTREIVSVARAASVKTVVGGPHITARPEDSLARSGADVAIAGEGEWALQALIGGRAQEEIEGVYFRRNGDIRKGRERVFVDPLDALPFPPRQVLDMRKYAGDTELGFHLPAGEKLMRILSSRGCSYLCTFCARHATFGRRVRFRSAENVVAEMMRLEDLWGARNFMFMDDTFTESSDHVRSITAEIRRSGRRFRWTACARVRIEEDLLADMHSAGCTLVQFGVETGSPTLLQEIRKEITPSQVRQGFERARRVGLRTKGFFMVGLPTEGEAEFRETLALACEVNPDYLWLSIFLPLPGSQIWADQGGIDQTAGRESFFFTSNRELNRRHRIFLRTFFFRWMYLKRFLGNLTLSEMRYFVSMAKAFLLLRLGVR